MPVIEIEGFFTSLLTLYSLVEASCPIVGELKVILILIKSSSQSAQDKSNWVVSDIVLERGRAFSIYTLAPLLGPAIGPIA